MVALQDNTQTSSVQELGCFGGFFFYRNTPASNNNKILEKVSFSDFI